MFQLKVNVRYLPSVVQPEAEVLKDLFAQKGMDQIAAVHVSKLYTIEMESPSAKLALEEIQPIIDQVLVNQAMQTYELTVEEV